MPPKPLLIVSDSVTAGTGLARITRDLAIRLATHMSDVYRVGTAGYGGPGSRHLPFPQYCLEGVRDFICPTLPQIWDDFAGKERGIVWFIWDISRVGWFSQPEHLGREVLAEFAHLKQWVVKGNFEKWIYTPLDGSGPNDKLTFPLQLALAGFDRILAYGEFGEGVIYRTLGKDESNKKHLTCLPHGIDTDIFFQLDQKLCRKLFFQNTGALPLINMAEIPPLREDERLIGIVATNIPRKDWKLGIEAVSIMTRTMHVRLWIHTNSLEQYWSIPALLADYGLLQQTFISLGYLSDEHLSEAYSACDLTLGIGPEGWGYPLAESQACGTPVITGEYAGGADIVPQRFKVKPVAFRNEGIYAIERPVYKAQDWAYRATSVFRNVSRNDVALDPEYEWTNLWPKWEDYLRKANM